MVDTKDTLPASEQPSDGSMDNNEAQLAANQSINDSEALIDQAGDVVVPSASESLDTWDHVEPVDEVISASDSEGREAYARLSRGTSPDDSRPLHVPAKAAPSQTVLEKSNAAARGTAKKEAISAIAEEQPLLPSDSSGKGVKKTPSAGKPSSKRTPPGKEPLPGQSEQNDGSINASVQKEVKTAGKLTGLQSGQALPGGPKGEASETLTVEGQGGRQTQSQVAPGPAQSSSREPSTVKSHEEEGEGASVGDLELPVKVEESGDATKDSNADGVLESNQPAWGWKSWTKLTEQLREAASGAARDVQELTSSFQQVLT
jgi:hypothetical protein